MRVITHYAPLYELETHFEVKFEQLEKAIQADISDEIVDANQKEIPKLQRALEQSKSKLSFLWEKLPPLPPAMQQFLDEEDSTQEQLAKLFPIVVSIVLMLSLAFAAWKYLNTKHEMSETQIILSEKKAYRWNTKDYTKEKFYVERSKYIGNQLENGATPFTRCFGENNVDGNNKVVFHNPYTDDAVVCLYNPVTNEVIQQAYVTGKSTYAFQTLPSGTYTMKLYLGKDWNPLKPNFGSLHGAFDSNPRYLKLKKKHNFELTDASFVVLPEAQVDSDNLKDLFFDLSARGFFNNHLREMKTE